MNEREAEIASAVPADLDSLPRLDGFRLRGLEMTRLETFIDAAFAFAITMLVIAAQQIPDDIETLLAAFKNVPAFIASVIVVGIFWRGPLVMEPALRLGRWQVDFHQLDNDGHNPDLYISAQSDFWFHVVSAQRWPRWSSSRAASRCPGTRSFRDLCPRLYRDRLGDPAAEFASLAIARAVTIERPGKVNDATRDNGMERARRRRARLTRVGSYLAHRAHRLERLDLFLDDDSCPAAHSAYRRRRMERKEK